MNFSQRNLASDSYTAYIIHPVVVVSITILLEQVELPPAYKFVIAVVPNICLTFLTAHLIRLIPGVKRVL